MPEYPLVFTFSDKVSGNGFLANVTINGRALVVKEGELWWMVGVRPAAIAEKGDSPGGAYVDFRRAFTAVLYDAAAVAVGFDAFKAEVERFFYERDETEEQRWNAAGEAIRSGAVTPEPPFAALPREAPQARPVAISVDRIDGQQSFTANDNVLDSYALSAAA